MKVLAPTSCAVRASLIHRSWPLESMAPNLSKLRKKPTRRENLARIEKGETMKHPDSKAWSFHPSSFRLHLDSLERETRFELATLALARRCSTTELLPLTKRS